jgi:hypothetical protein
MTRGGDVMRPGGVEPSCFASEVLHRCFPDSQRKPQRTRPGKVERHSFDRPYAGGDVVHVAGVGLPRGSRFELSPMRRPSSTTSFKTAPDHLRESIADDGMLLPGCHGSLFRSRVPELANSETPSPCYCRADTHVHMPSSCGTAARDWRNQGHSPQTQLRVHRVYGGR